MGMCLDKPVTLKQHEQGEGNGIKYATCAMQGWRYHMEDAHQASITLAQDPNSPLSTWSYFGLFDGHAGPDVARHCVGHLLDTMIAETQTRGVPAGYCDESSPEFLSALEAGFVAFDKSLRLECNLGEAARMTGSTAVCCLVTPRRITLLNCGDSRAILCRDGNPLLVTRDHKPSDPAEKERICEAGGVVFLNRVNGGLAVSRALGDFAYKCGSQGEMVSGVPEILGCARREESDEFLLLACDGVWDVLSSQEVCAFVRHLLQITDDLIHIVDRLVDACLAKGSLDNISVVLVVFPAAPKPQVEVQNSDRRLDELIRSRITELLKMGMPNSDILEELRLIPSLAPGAGIYDKWTIVQQYIEAESPPLDECT